MMQTRPDLNKTLSGCMFRNFYYLKEELVVFCKQEGLQASGSKLELTERVAVYLDSGRKLTSRHLSRRSTRSHSEITEDSVVEPAFVCSEKHRAFFKRVIGKRFSFPVAFQKWLKNNAGRSYREAIAAYYEILEERKKGLSSIDQQFEYNSYIRDFFAENPDKALKDAIRCWKYKKGLPGHHRYDASDMANAPDLPERHEG